MKYTTPLLAALLLVVGGPLAGQTIEIEPQEPSSTDTIKITVSGVASCPFLSEPAVLGQLVVLSFTLGDCLFPPDEFSFTRFLAPLDGKPYTLVLLENLDGSVIEKRDFEVTDAGTPPIPEGAFLESASVPGFRFKVRISDGQGGSRMGSFESNCLPETICASGALEGRTEVLLRVVGPKPNGFLWPTFIRFTTSTVEIWVERIANGGVKYYRLDGVVPGTEELDGLFDRNGFLP